MSPTLRHNLNNSSLIDKLETTVDTIRQQRYYPITKVTITSRSIPESNTTQLVFAKPQLAKLINPQSEILPNVKFCNKMTIRNP